MLKSICVALSAVLLLGFGVFTLGVSATGVEAASRFPGKPLTIRELRALYSGKTWFWKDGGGYFRRDGRFIALSGRGKGKNSLMGGWAAYRGGKVCFSGKWKSRRWTFFGSNCFAHRWWGRSIYQKRLPAGKWYVFKHARTRKGDEYRKVVRGNYANWYIKRRRHRTRVAKRNRRRIRVARQRKRWTRRGLRRNSQRRPRRYEVSFNPLYFLE